MRFAFSDISLYIPTTHAPSTPEYVEETFLHNFVSDLYVIKMKGYKPPNTVRVTIQPGFFNIWNGTWKNGAIVHIAPEFRRDLYDSLNKKGKYQYILDLIQHCMIQLSEEYNWDKQVFQKAYNDVLESDFVFTISYPKKISPNKKRKGCLIIKKTETQTTVYAQIQHDISTTKIKLFDKRNGWWYDGAYQLVKSAKWFDADRFGLNYNKGQFTIWYSIKDNNVSYFVKGNGVTQIELCKYFIT